jgi:hypothetical protein
MSGPDDTTPPPLPEPPTTAPVLPDVSELPIHAGDAALTMLAALANLTAAVVAVERVAMALARAVDATAKPPTVTP